MNDNLLATWEFSSDSKSTSTILPDGCRDLILRTEEGEPPSWSVSSLFDQAKPVLIQAGTVMSGFRLKAGVNIRRECLLNSVSDNHYERDDIFNRIDDFSYRNPHIERHLNI